MYDFILRFRFLLIFFYTFIASMSLLFIGSTFNGGTDVAVKVLAVPGAVLIFGFTFIYRQRLYAFYPKKNG